VSEPQSIPDQIDQIRVLLREKLGVRAPDLGHALAKVRHRLPRRLYNEAMVLVRAEALAAHPKLRLTLDGAALGRAIHALRAHLEAIDVADRRKGWWLGMLGGLSFNLILMFFLLLALLMWRGFV
jgi:hypothetical protein